MKSKIRIRNNECIAVICAKPCLSVKEADSKCTEFKIARILSKDKQRFANKIN